MEPRLIDLLWKGAAAVLVDGGLGRRQKEDGISGEVCATSNSSGGERAGINEYIALILDMCSAPGPISCPLYL